jgi:hypothetical protein
VQAQYRYWRSEFPDDVVLTFGSERHGFPPGFLARCDDVLAILPLEDALGCAAEVNEEPASPVKSPSLSSPSPASSFDEEGIADMLGVPRPPSRTPFSGLDVFDLHTNLEPAQLDGGRPRRR